MSFVIFVEADDLTWERAAEVASACRASNGLETSAPRRPRFFGRGRRPHIWINDHHGDDHMLAEDADWDAETWSLTSTLLPHLEATVRCLSQHLPSGFTFFAGWIGDDEITAYVTPDELVDLAARGNLATHTRYVVRHQD